jgi:putative membrane protein
MLWLRWTIARAMENRELLSEAALDRIEAAVADAERATSCQFVVVIAPAASRYEGRVLACGVAAAVLTFVALFWANTLLFGESLNALLLLIEALAAGALATWLFARVHALRRLIVPRWRMAAAVEDASSATFTAERMTETAQRNAVLLFVSVLEGEARLMPDVGVREKVSEARLGEILASLKNAESGVNAVCEAISALAEECRKAFPPNAQQENSLPDRPQIRLP